MAHLVKFGTHGYWCRTRRDGWMLQFWWARRELRMMLWFCILESSCLCAMEITAGRWALNVVTSNETTRFPLGCWTINFFWIKFSIWEQNKKFVAKMKTKLQSTLIYHFLHLCYSAWPSRIPRTFSLSLNISWHLVINIQAMKFSVTFQNIVLPHVKCWHHFNCIAMFPWTNFILLQFTTIDIFLSLNIIIKVIRGVRWWVFFPFLFFEARRQPIIRWSWK